ncbi:prokaryotic phospholipase A2-domain-containing protein [Phlyctochytrium arcticum]|nr:prokaryotic phospholipase A2-domain-containing protein [Phlyctochytrium arcticum]
MFSLMHSFIVLILAFASLISGAPVAPGGPASELEVKQANGPTPEGQALLLKWTQIPASSRDQFLQAQKESAKYSKAPYNLIFATDGCDSSPDQPFGFDFRPACARHDFGYDNYKALNNLKPNKERVDLAFYEDMWAICGNSKTCKGTAWVYYTAVKNFGSKLRPDVQPVMQQQPTNSTVDASA